MEGGTISSSDTGILIDRGTLILGNKGEPVSPSNPSIYGKKKGISNSGTFNFYDGIIKGPIDNSIVGEVLEIEPDYEIITSKDTKEESKYLSRSVIATIVETETPYYNLQTAIDSATDNQNIRIERDIVVLSTAPSYTINADKNITIDFNGHTVDCGNNNCFVNNGTVVFDNNSSTINNITSMETTIIQNNNNLTLNKGNYYSKQSAEKLIDNNGILKINDGVKISANGYSKEGSVIHNSQEGEITIKGLTLSIDRNHSQYITSITNLGTLNINSGNIDGRIESQGEVNVSDGTINVLNNSDNTNITGGTVSRITSSGNLDISGEVYVITLSSSGSSIINADFGDSGTDISNAGEMTIKNIDANAKIINTGTLNFESGTITYNYSANIIENNNGTVNIGKDDNNVEKDIVIINAKENGIVNNGGTLNIYDGKIYGKIPVYNLTKIPTGYSLIEDTDDKGTYVYLSNTEDIASIDSKKFKTVQSALDAADSGETVKLLHYYITASESYEKLNVIAEKNITFDLNGKLIISNIPYMIENLGTLAIDDSSDNSSNKILSINSIIFTNNGDLTINKGTIETKEIETALIENKKNLTIKDINIKQDVISDYTPSYLMQNTGNLIIKGGTYYKNTLGAMIKNSNQLEMSGGEYTTEVLYAYGLNDRFSYIIQNELGGNTQVNGGSQISKRNAAGDYFLLNNGVATLSDVTISTSCPFINNGTLNLNNVTVEEMYNSISNSNSGTIDIQSGSYKSSKANILENSENSTLKINSAEMLETGYNDLKGYNVLSNSGNAQITDSQITSTGVKGHTIYTSSSGHTSITNSQITSSGTSSYAIQSSGNVDINGESTVSGYEIALFNSDSAIANINGNTTLKTTADHYTIYSVYGIYNNGTINFGIKDQTVNDQYPKAEGLEYGINDNSIFNFYDGRITGEIGKSINGIIDDVEPGYKKTSETADLRETSYLVRIGEDERVLESGGLNYTDLQSAINAANLGVTEMTLYSNINLTSDIIVPAGKEIRLKLNGFTITYNTYHITGEGKFTTIDLSSHEENILGSIVNLVKNALNIDTNEIKKNIVVYEMNDGEKLKSNKTYKLYKDGKLVKVDEGDSLGRYTIGNIEEEMKTVRGRIYLNNLSSGEYEVIDNDGKKIGFTITENGEVYGSVRESVNTQRVLVASAISELILSIQTGMTSIKYLLLISLVTIILLLLVIIQRKKSIN